MTTDAPYDDASGNVRGSDGAGPDGAGSDGAGSDGAGSDGAGSDGATSEPIDARAAGHVRRAWLRAPARSDAVVAGVGGRGHGHAAWGCRGGWVMWRPSGAVKASPCFLSRRRVQWASWTSQWWNAQSQAALSRSVCPPWLHQMRWCRS